MSSTPAAATPTASHHPACTGLPPARTRRVSMGRIKGSLAVRSARPSTPNGEMRRVDRKSTRLNSSHSQISYAVFCLKKKKNNTILTELNPLSTRKITPTYITLLNSYNTVTIQTTPQHVTTATSTPVSLELCSTPLRH